MFPQELTKCLESNALKHSQNSGGLIDGNLYAKTIIHSTPFFVTVVERKRKTAADLIIRGFQESIIAN